MKTLLKNSGVIVTTLFAISIVLAILGICGIDRKDVLFMAVWTLFMTLPFCITVYSIPQTSPCCELFCLIMLPHAEEVVYHADGIDCCGGAECPMISKML